MNSGKVCILIILRKIISLLIKTVCNTENIASLVWRKKNSWENQVAMAGHCTLLAYTVLQSIDEISSISSLILLVVGFLGKPSLRCTYAQFALCAFNDHFFFIFTFLTSIFFYNFHHHHSSMNRTSISIH